MILRTVYLAILILTVVNFSLAQIRATTESGNKVLLYDNGTWVYEEKSITKKKDSALETGAVIAATFDVDSTREYATDREELFYLPSPRLVKFFGESGGKIRCKLSCSNSLGVVKIHFNWEFPVVDGNRYFGFFDEGSKVTFAMHDGQTVELVMEDKNNVKNYKKHNSKYLQDSRGFI